MSQRVLVVPSDLVREFYQYRCVYKDQENIDNLLAIIKNNSLLIRRNIAESTEKYKQLVSVGVIRNCDRTLCVMRSKTSNRELLRRRWTLMVGGHVDELDADSDDAVSHCLFRELSEEIGIREGLQTQMAGFIIDPANAVGRLHIGVVYQVNVDRRKLPKAKELDASEFEKSKGAVKYQFLKNDQICRLRNRLDPWSFVYARDCMSCEFPCDDQQRQFCMRWDDAAGVRH